MSGNSSILRPVLWAAMSLALLGSCGKDIPEDTPGGGISFSPSTSGEGATKTTYTGDGTYTGTGTDQTLDKERIDWVDGDLFTIVCAQAKVYDTSTRPWKLVYSVTSPSAYSTADYRVKTHQTENATVSRATIEAVDKGLQWDKNAGDHTFHALYPAASTAGYSTEEKAKVAITPTGFSATIPESQTPQWDNNGWPQMRYAYMYAPQTTAPNAKSVNLPFEPQFTAFEFTVEAGENESVSLTSFTFEAVDTDAAVTGDFSYSFADGTVTPSGKSNKITVDLSGRSVSAAVGTTPARNLRFTVLGLPVNMTAMRMTFTGTEIGTRTLVLKKNGSEITFSARKKYRIKGIQFPKNGSSGGGEQIIWDQEAFGEDILWDEDQYILEGTIPATLQTSHFGGTVPLATDFRSCWAYETTSGPEPFIFQHSADGVSWTDGLPDWLSSSGIDLSGATAATTPRLTLSPLVTNGSERSAYIRILQPSSGKTTSACQLTQGFLTFSVSASKKVIFAHGNLVVTYKANGNHLWEFEQNQWDYSYGSYTGRPYEGMSNYETDGTRISHFGWATAGIKNNGRDYGYDVHHEMYQPYSIESSNNNSSWYSDNYFRYGPSVSDLYWANAGGANLPFGINGANSWNMKASVRKYCDWGVHFDNAGVGSNDTENGSWETLSVYEWAYLLPSGSIGARSTSLFGVGNIYIDAENRKLGGLFILPDNWVEPVTCSFNSGLYFSSNNYTTGNDAAGFDGKWSDMEAAGVVFLPAAGRRNNVNDKAWDFSFEETYGYYWSSSASKYDNFYDSGAYCLYIRSAEVDPRYNPSRYFGHSVRLVRNITPTQYVLEGTVPAELSIAAAGGTVNLATNFLSYLDNGSTTTKEPFVLQYSATGADGSWSNGLPDWLSSPGTDLSGAVTATTLSLTAGALAAYSPDRSTYIRIRQPASGETTAACQITQGFPRFSVSATKKVMFAPGNLRVNASVSPRQWAFEQNQWDFNTSTKFDAAYISHFGWGTGDVPEKTSTQHSDYQNYTNWGRHFDDEGNGSDAYTKGRWYALSSDEWAYLLSTSPVGRANADLLRGHAQIYDAASDRTVNGLVILPDGWVLPEGCSFSPTQHAQADSFSSNRYTTGTDAAGYDGLWSRMEENGAVFLPAADGRYRTDIIVLGSAHYWSSSRYDVNNYDAFNLVFSHQDLYPQYTTNLNIGCCVRLVHNYD